MRDAGVDFFTSGNHIWAKREGLGLLEGEESLVIRPANYPSNTPGGGMPLQHLAKTVYL